MCVTLDGEPVVDLRAGERNDAGDPWERDTIVNVYSTTKTMAATVMLMLADRGEIDFDAPVATYWPEFKANGKEGMPVAHVLGHTAAVPGFARPFSNDELYDQDACAANLAGQEPWWEPGTQSGYHAITQGHLEARSCGGSPAAASARSSARRWPSRSAPTSHRASGVGGRPGRRSRPTGRQRSRADRGGARLDRRPHIRVAARVTARHPHPRLARRRDPGRRRHRQRPLGRPGALGARVRR